jgi:HEAT repeats
MRRIILLQLALGSALGGCAKTPPSADGASSGPAGSAEAAASAQKTRSDPAGSAWQVDKLYPYSFVLSTALSMNDDPAFDFDLAGTLRVAPVASTANEASLYLTVEGAKVTSRIPSGQAELDKLAAQIQSGGCFVDLQGGKVSAVHLPVGLGALAANVYRELAADLQFASGSSGPFTTTEYDTTGEYVATYTPLADSLHVTKQKQRYLSVLGGTVPNLLMPSAPTQIVPQVVASNADITLTAAHRPSVIHAKNQVLVSGAQVPVRSTTQISLEAAAEQPLLAPRPDFAALLSKTARLGADEPYGAQASVDALDDARIHGETFASLYLKVSQLPHEGDAARAVSAAVAAGAPAPLADQKSNQDSARVFIALAALFRRQPATIDLAVQKIHANAIGADMLLDALGSASSPASQHALLGLLKDKSLPAPLETRAMRALTRGQRPSEEAVAALQALLVAKPFDQVPLYGLGTFCRRLRDENELDRSNALGDLLLSQLGRAQGQSAVVTVLEALSNAGYAKALTPLQTYMRDPREAVRVAAVRGLQSIKDAQVDPLLANAITSEASSDVRIAAMDVAKMREPSQSLADALTSAAVKAPDPHVRYRAVELMGQWLARWPSLRGPLTAVASNDAESQVRERAKASL